MRGRDSRGLTLVEVLLASSILAAIVVLLIATLRVGVQALETGERRAAAQQELRAVVELVTDALAAAYPYRARVGINPQRVVLFEGESDQVRFVTTAPPLLLDAPAVPFHAVVLRHTGERELRVVERLVPAEEPFPDGPSLVLSRSVTALKLEYRDPQGLWQSTWDGPTASALPVAVRVELTFQSRGRPSTTAAFVVPIALGKETT